jgi:hypothetical protein
MMSVTEYRNHPAMSYSKLKAYYKSPLHGLMQKPPSESAAMRFGTAVDLACKGQFSEVVMNPFEDGRTKAAKDFKAENQGRVVMSPAEYEAVSLCYVAIQNHPAVKELALGFGDPDKPLFGDILNLPVKGLPDWIVTNAVIDLKTTSQGIGPDQFSKTVDSYGWDMQAAMYLELALQNGIQNPEFYWVAVESENPFDVAVYRATQQIKEVGKYKLEKAIKNYFEAMNGNVKGISQSCIPLEMPPWYTRQLNVE